MVVPKKLKLVAAGLLGLLLVGGAAASFMYGSGGITVVAPDGSSVQVSDNGKALGTVEAGEHKKFHLDQGEHQVKLTTGSNMSSEHKLSVTNGMFDQVLPVGKQCFGVFDVTNYWYQKKGLLDRLGSDITVTEKHVDAQPFDVPTKYFSTDDLPSKVKQNERTKVLLAVPCDKAGGSDTALISVMFK